MKYRHFYHSKDWVPIGSGEFQETVSVWCRLHGPHAERIVNYVSQIVEEFARQAAEVSPEHPSETAASIARVDSVLNLCFRRVGDRSHRQAIRHVQARHANPVVGHSVIDIEAVR